MSLSDPSGDISAQLTSKARELIARATLGEVVFIVRGFGLGRSGYNPSNVVEALPTDPETTELADKVFPTSSPLDYEEFVSTESPSNTVRVYNCRVEANPNPGNADYALGEIGLYAEVLKSTDPAEVGEVFLYAVSHFPVVCKTRRDTLLRRVVVSY